MPKQTGPKTPEGKAKSAQNAIKHGLASNRMFVLSNENQEIWNFFLNSWTEALEPRNDAERMIVTDIAHAQWRLRRAFTVECGMIDLEMDQQAEQMAAIFMPPIDEGTRMACAFKGLGDKSRGLDHLHRYETRARRAFKSGLAALEQLRRLTSTPAAGAAPAPKQPETAPEPQGKTAQDHQKPAPKPVPVPAKRPAAQQVAPEVEKLPNEIKKRCRPQVPAARREAVRRLREALGIRVGLRSAPPARLRHA